MALISFRIDDQLINESEQVFRSIGMDMTTALNVFLRQVVKENGMPFQTGAKEENNLKYLEKLDGASESLDAGNGVVFAMDELAAFETMSAKDTREFIEKRKAECDISCDGSPAKNMGGKV